mgnify:CR=1 FL=1
MIAQLSDGTLHDVATPAEALALAVEGLRLDGLHNDDDTIPVPIGLVRRMDRERGPGTSHTDRNATVDLLMEHVPGRGRN